MHQMQNPAKHDAINRYKSQLLAVGSLTAAVNDALDTAHSIVDRHNLIVYVAGSLTGATQADKQRYELVAAAAAALHGQKSVFAYVPHLHGTDPITHPDVTPADVRTIDFLASAIIADAQLNFTYPLAHGNAIELAWAETAGIPAWLVTPRDQHTSRLTRGMKNIAGTITYHRFADDGIIQVTELLSDIAAGTTTVRRA